MAHRSPGAEQWNDYNELDLTKPMNVHAVTSQVQRFLKSIIEIFRLNDQNEQDFRMNTTLDSDTHETAWTTTAFKRKDDPVQQPETWLFVNGIAGEFYWNRLAVSKIRDFFFDRDAGSTSTEEAQTRATRLRGIYNRSDGILWDLVECGGERQPDVAPLLIHRTESSKAAQRQLAVELRAALADSRSSKRDIIMIAHSQGCLLLRLALDELWAAGGADTRSTMRAHLRVYTFGNPAYDWDVHAYAATTEHFANELDFVAVLGVLRLSDPVDISQVDVMPRLIFRCLQSLVDVQCGLPEFTSSQTIKDQSVGFICLHLCSSQCKERCLKTAMQEGLAPEKNSGQQAASHNRRMVSQATTHKRSSLRSAISRPVQFFSGDCPVALNKISGCSTSCVLLADRGH
ncbi:hypothetical protein L1887_59369 [Cichorium endivia]|nr:hypothetical protein L1887_59369 [Cichorium endivia]